MGLPRPLDDDIDDSDHFYDWDGHQKKQGFWTDERVALLTKFWNNDLVARDIARRLGCTRNAVIGKANRIGLPPRDKNDFQPVFRNTKRGKGFSLRRGRKG